MAGGTFDLGVGKTRPGTYINFEAKRTAVTNAAARGIAVVPLFGYDWGSAGFLEVDSAAPDAQISKLGRSITDPHPGITMIREALKNAITVQAYIPGGGTKASATVEAANGMKVEAAYGGTLGNSLKVTSVENVLGGYDVAIYLGTEIVEKAEGVATIDALAGMAFQYVKFSGSGALAAFAGATLTGGTDGTKDKASVTAYLDAAEAIKCDTIAFPVSDEDLQAAVKAKAKYMRDGMGKYVQFVVPNYAADYEGIINVTNSAVVDEVELTVEQATAYVAGLTAGATMTESNTNTVWEGATAIVGPKTHEEAVQAIQNGEFFFSMSEAGEVVAEYDINSLVTFADKKTEDYRKNRIIRVYDTFANELKEMFPPNKFSNTETEWSIMEGLGKGILQSYSDAGAIQNVDKENDFYVDRSRSGGESTYFVVGIQAVDSAEKLYFSIGTR